MVLVTGSNPILVTFAACLTLFFKSLVCLPSKINSTRLLHKKLREKQFLWEAKKFPYIVCVPDNLITLLKLNTLNTFFCTLLFHFACLLRFESLFLHSLSVSGIDKSIDPFPTTLRCPPLFYFVPMSIQEDTYLAESLWWIIWLLAACSLSYLLVRGRNQWQIMWFILLSCPLKIGMSEDNMRELVFVHEKMKMPLKNAVAQK